MRIIGTLKLKPHDFRTGVETYTTLHRDVTRFFIPTRTTICNLAGTRVFSSHEGGLVSIDLGLAFFFRRHGEEYECE